MGLRLYGTDPFNPDTNGDGLTDYAEIHIHKTDPLNPDTDGDKISDGDEIIVGLDPLNTHTFGIHDSEYTQWQDVSDSALSDFNNNNEYTLSIRINSAGYANNSILAEESGCTY